MGFEELRLVVDPEDGLRRLRHGTKYSPRFRPPISEVRFSAMTPPPPPPPPPPSPPSPPAAPPYALASTTFRFAALASLAGRAPLGGQREVALAVYVAARLADDALPDRAVSPAARAERANGARHWLSTLALPANAVRTSLTRLIDATTGDPADAGRCVSSVIDVTGSYLEPAARTELEHLAKALAKAAGQSGSQALVE